MGKVEVGFAKGKSIYVGIGGGRGVLRTGFGAGIGFEFGVNKSTFGVELKFNSYVVRGYDPLQFGSVGVKAAI